MRILRRITWVVAAALMMSCSAKAGAVLTHVYNLNNSLADAFGGPSLVNNGATLSATGLAFGANQGPNLSNAISATDYSIEVKFSFDATSGYRKIIDFLDKGSDNGLYNLSNTLDFYNAASGGTLAAGVTEDVVLTRNGATNTVVGFVNGGPVLSFNDSSNIAVFGAANQLIRFFQDDTHTGGNESSSGNVSYIAIYSGALTSDQVAVLFRDGSPTGPTGVSSPEPATIVSALVAGVVAIGYSRRRRAAR